MHDDKTYLPAGQVRARYGVSDMALWRWLRDEISAFQRPSESITDATGNWLILNPGKLRELTGARTQAQHSPTNAKAARWQGGFAETIKKVEKPKFSRSGCGFQDYTSRLSQTCFWRDSLAARITDARSRVVIGLHINELNSIKDEVAAFKAHCTERPSFGGEA